MTTAELIQMPEFIGQCVCWQETGRAFLPFADWFIDNGMDDHAAGWRWLAMTGKKLPSLLKRNKLLDYVLYSLNEWTAGNGLSWEQLDAFERLVNASEQVRTLGGYAGTGKTRLLTFLANHFGHYDVCSFTGKVAALLRKKGIRRARTIHSTIYDRVERNGRVTWRKKHKRAVGGGFIVDEASMVSKPMLDDMLSFDVPIIAIGDHGQLPPVGEDAGLMKEPMVTLEKVHRNAAPIARFAEFLRKGGEALDWTPREGKQVYVMEGRSVPNASLLNADQILCAFNKTRVGLNKLVRELRYIHGYGTAGELFSVPGQAQPTLQPRV